MKTYRDILEESIKPEELKIDRRKSDFGRRYKDRPFDPKNDDPIIQAARRFSEFDAPARRLGAVARRAKEEK